MTEQPRLKSKRTMWKKIRQLDLPEATKQKLRDLWQDAKALAQRVVEWLYLRRELCCSIMLGVVLAYLLHPFPILGSVLSTLSITLSVLYGIGLQFRADLARAFPEGRFV